MSSNVDPFFDKKLQIYNKFVELSNKYYKTGNYIMDVKLPDYIPADKFVKSFTSLSNIGMPYDFEILEYNQPVNPFNINNLTDTQMRKIIWMPVTKIPKAEFEELFGFGVGGKHYSANKQIMVFPKRQLYTFTVVKTAMLNNPYDDTWIGQVKDLMLYGGYVNNKSALVEIMTV